MKHNYCLLILVTLLTIGCNGKSLELNVPAAADDSEARGELTWWSRAAIDSYLRYNVWSDTRSGFVALLARDGVPVYANAVGWKDIASGQPMTMDTPVRLASMTKPVTAVAALILIEEGKLRLDDPVAQYIPAFANPRVVNSETPDEAGNFESQAAKNPLLVRHLLMFSSGIGPGMGEKSPLVDYWNEHGIHELPQGSLAQRVDHIAKLPLFEEPGTRWRYGWSADVLARVVEVASGETISNFMQQRIFQPLGMNTTRYLPEVTDHSELATVYTQDEDGNLVLAPLHSDTQWTPGGSGLVATAGDYMRFALMLWNRGEYQGVRILSEQSIYAMTQLHVPSGVLAASDIEGMGWGLGLSVVADADATMTPDRKGDFWWAGYYGTTFFVSPSTGLVGVVLSQNEPGEYSGLPVAVYVVQGLAFAGL
jgi:CubicO group peptidase (beta-lactamase class C family)